MKRERLEYFAIKYFIYWNSKLLKFSLEIVNVLPNDVRYAERFRHHPRIAPYARYDYLSVPDIVIYFFTEFLFILLFWYRVRFVLFPH